MVAGFDNSVHGGWELRAPGGALLTPDGPVFAGWRSTLPSTGRCTLRLEFPGPELGVDNYTLCLSVPV